jgi:four helix bundle protein
MSYNSFENLEVWKRSCRLSVELYRLLENCTDYGLKNQMTRAAVSIASNIAEGVERNSPKEFKRFLNIAKGSAAELRTQVYIAGEINIFTEAQRNSLIIELKEISAMLHGLSKSIASKK